MFGVSRHSKAYRLYDLETKKIIISRDVHFDESKGWEWEEKYIENELAWSDSVEEENSEINHEAEQIPEENPEEPEVEEEENAGETQHIDTQQTSVLEVVGRMRQKPVWMKDYVTGNASFLVTEEEE